MFYQGIAGTFFAELESVQNSATDPVCQKCFKPLPRKGRGTKGPGYISFWTIRCEDPDCNQAHIIFNSTSVLPQVTATPEPAEKPPLIDFKKLLKNNDEDRPERKHDGQ